MGTVHLASTINISNKPWQCRWHIKVLLKKLLYHVIGIICIKTKCRSMPDWNVIGKYSFVTLSDILSSEMRRNIACIARCKLQLLTMMNIDSRILYFMILAAFAFTLWFHYCTILWHHMAEKESGNQQQEKKILYRISITEYFYHFKKIIQYATTITYISLL